MGAVRVVFECTETIPGVAEEGDQIAVYLDGRDKPVVSYSQHGPDALRAMGRHRDRVTLIYPPPRHLPPALNTLLLDPVQAPDPSGYPDLKVVD